MDIPFSRWYSVIQSRRSRRNFDSNRPIEPAALATLEKVCRDFSPFPHARTFLVNKPEKDIFKGVIGGYGKVSGSQAFVAFIGDTRGTAVQEEVGYTGEGIILEATALGLNTCWVGGFFKPETVASLIEIGPGERVLAVSPVGYASESESVQEKLMTGFGRTHARLPISKIANYGNGTNLPAWIKASIEAARLAPSAVNRQPWGFNIQDDSITVSVRTQGQDFHVSKRLDCGIAMLHLEIGAGAAGIKGNWKFLQPPQVAKFTAIPS